MSRTFQSLRPSHHGSDVPLAPDPSPATTSTASEVQKSVYWPADILPDKVPDARIWTYGYNADVISGFFGQNNQNSILKHANDFMVKLERTLRDDVSGDLTKNCHLSNVFKRGLSSSSPTALADSLSKGYVGPAVRWIGILNAVRHSLKWSQA